MGDHSLPNHMFFQVAENLPKDPEGIIACCNPVPPLINQHVSEIIRFVAEARFFDPQDATPAADQSAAITSTLEKIEKEKKDAVKLKTGSFDPRTGFEIYNVSGPKIATKETSIPLIKLMLKDHLVSQAGKRKAKELMEILKSPFEMYLPNTGKLSVEPVEIIESWKQKSLERMKEASAGTTITNVPSPTPTPAEEYINVPHDKGSIGGGKKRRRYVGKKVQDEQTLRQQLPSKKGKTPKPLSEHLDELAKNNDVPVKMDYQKNVGSHSDFVPFDYSKADLKKFSAASTKGDAVNLDQTEEPDFKGPIKTKLSSGARQMTF